MARARYQRRLTAEILERRQMFALEPTYGADGPGFTINGTPTFDQKSTTMGYLLNPGDPAGVPLATVLGGYRIDPNREFYPDSGQPELMFFDGDGDVLNIGPASVPVGLGDSRIAGIDSYVRNGVSYIVTAGYTEVSGRDLIMNPNFDTLSPGNPFALSSLSRDFDTPDIGATIRIIDSQFWVAGDYVIRDVIFVNGFGRAFLDTNPVDVPDPTAIVGGGIWAIQDPENDLPGTDVLVSQYFLSITGQVVLDASFGINGHAIIPIASGVNNFDYGYAIDVDPSNNILVAGYSQNASGQYDFSILRLTPDGVLDDTFYFTDQPGGPVAGRGRVQINVNGNDYANAIDVNEDLDIMVAGSSGGITSPLLTFLKLKPNGSLDLTFDSAGGSDGIVVIPRTIGRNGFINDIEEYPADSTSPGFYIASGTLTGSNRDTVVLRIDDETGALDRSFAGTGVLRTDLGSGRDDWGNSVQLQRAAAPAPAGTYGIVVGGSVEVSSEGFNIYVSRYNSDGSDDNTFNDGANLFVVDLQDATSQNRDDYGATILINRFPGLGPPGAANDEFILISGSTEFTSVGDFDFVIACVVGFPNVRTTSVIASALSRSVVEGDDSSASVLIELVLSKPATSPVTVRYTTQNGTAKAGVDYIAKTNSVTFTAGTTSRIVSVQLKGNTQYQANRSFGLAIIDVDGAVAGDSLAQVEIRDNDGTWQNVMDPEDADADGDVEPHDILQVKDDLNRFGIRQLIQATATPSLFTDVTGDTWFTPADLLVIIDSVNRSFAGISAQFTSEEMVGSAILASTESSAPIDVSLDVARGLAIVGVCPVGPFVVNPIKPSGTTASGVLTAEVDPVCPPAADVAFADYSADSTESGDADDLADNESSELYELIAAG